MAVILYFLDSLDQMSHQILRFSAKIRHLRKYGYIYIYIFFYLLGGGKNTLLKRSERPIIYLKGSLKDTTIKKRNNF